MSISTDKERLIKFYIELSILLKVSLSDCTNIIEILKEDNISWLDIENDFDTKMERILSHLNKGPTCDGSMHYRNIHKYICENIKK